MLTLVKHHARGRGHCLSAFAFVIAFVVVFA